MKLRNPVVAAILLFLMVFSHIHLFAQEARYKGRIMDAKTKMPVEYAHIMNYSQRMNAYSDSSGLFSLPVNPGDTLVLSAVGYYFRKIVATDSLLSTAPRLVFSIIPRAYEINEARIYSLGTYSEFRQRVIRMERPKTQTDLLAENIAELSRVVAKEAYEKAMQSRKLDGITFFSIPIRSPEEMERLRLAKIMEKENIRNEIYEKFNPEVIKKITGLKDDDVVIEFMVFCDFPDDYLLEVNSYDLMVRIEEKFEDFKKKRWRNAPLNPMNTILGDPKTVA
jgi:hypothetical protein